MLTSFSAKSPVTVTAPPNREALLEAERLFFDNRPLSRIPTHAEIKNVYDVDNGNTLRVFCHLMGLYGLPTVEFVNYLRELIGPPEKAIEIGAGHGLFSLGLGIRATDSKAQEDPKWQLVYALSGQPTVLYGSNVEKLEATEAVRKYKPACVFGSWVTHKYKETEHTRGGFAEGVDEDKILSRDCVKKYILVGNTGTHSVRKTLTDPPKGWRVRCLESEFYWSRSANPNGNRIWVWERP